MEMKGLILSGGKGTRLRPITHTRAKQLIPVANKPILFYGIEALKEVGIRDIGIIVGETREEIKKACGNGEKWGIKITYIDQTEPLGLAHAVLTAENYIKDSPFVMYLGDNVIKDGVVDIVNEFKKNQPHSQILLAHVSNPSQFGVARLEGDQVVELIEKPKAPPSDLALVGVYLFDKNIFQASRSIDYSKRGELEITDAIQWLIDNKFEVHSHIIKGWWKDTGKLADLLEANRMMLDILETNIKGEVDSQSEIHFKVVIEKGAEVKNSVIRGPAIIGEKTKIVNSYVGPFSSISKNCLIDNCELEHLIVLEESIIQNVSKRIYDSLIGRHVAIKGDHRLPQGYSFMIGENCELHVL